MPHTTVNLDHDSDSTSASPSGSALPVSHDWPRIHLAAGTVLFRPGQSGDSMYRIRSGRLTVLQQDPTGCVEVDRYETARKELAAWEATLRPEE